MESKKKITVKIPSNFIKLNNGLNELTTGEPGSLNEVLNKTVLTNPKLNDAIKSEDNTFRPYISFSINGVNSRQLDGMETKIKQGDIVMILSPIAGG
ncbi:MoaD/ThiS family protein [Pseudoalteromonas rubra]|uniref:Thiamine biosynthesis protein ThiS n=1 Tax=Pseudoalteromonas rubra TaxID=43658 RepID=A0A0F4QVU8_9GAMM|nr:MoaD/ThiS family protein [Pseudoalteromonas rubra]KJZ11424.1 hypothetical protein TW77_05975 [Pseudoalteromonas rubra]